MSIRLESLRITQGEFDPSISLSKSLHHCNDVGAVHAKGGKDGGCSC